MNPCYNFSPIISKASNTKVLNILIFGLCLLLINVSELACRAKSCPAYSTDTPQKRGLFKGKKTKTKSDLFTKKQGRF